jgi:hypothetical protein
MKNKVKQILILQRIEEMLKEITEYTREIRNSVVAKDVYNPDNIEEQERANALIAGAYVSTDTNIIQSEKIANLHKELEEKFKDVGYKTGKILAEDQNRVSFFEKLVKEKGEKMNKQIDRESKSILKTTGDNKYYIPSIEEFYVGFEYQFRGSGLDTWINHKYNSSDSIKNKKLNPENYRVKYLDSDDIESLGFKNNYNNNNYDTGLDLIWAIDKIENKENTYSISKDFKILFEGIIKNKSELIKILQMVGYQ